MKIKRGWCLSALMAAGVAIAAPATTSATGSFERSGFLKVTKECSQFTGEAGSFCTITSSNIPEIKAGSKIFYTQPSNIPPGMTDTNIVLDAGGGNRAVGRCTLDDTTGVGICTLSDGMGRLAGFAARVDVSPPKDGVNWSWHGTYEFKSVGIPWPRRRNGK